jgi:hypothetical protein
MIHKSIFVLVFIVLGLGTLLVSFSASAESNYSSGSYGACQYNTCGISLTTSNTVNLNTIPTASASCTISSDNVSVLTDASTGYSLSINDFNTDNNLDGSLGGTIPSLSATSSSPATLSSDTWGYRVDGVLGFGTGPTSSQANGSVPSLVFAQVPVSTSVGDIIASSTVAADPAVSTSVWYGLCADVSIPSDTYSDNVVYTAVVN